MRIVIDTNIWISSLLSKYLRERIQNILGEERILILFSNDLVTEIEKVANRSKIRKYISEDDANTFL